MSTQANSKLSIVIPTFNRAEFLDYSLGIHVPLVRRYGIQIFISDNASTDNTAEVVGRWMKSYPLIRYNLNESNLGPDANFEIALKLPDTDYVWLLGDTNKIPEDVFERVVEHAATQYDVILLNADSRVADAGVRIFSDIDFVLKSIGWHMTLMSVLILSKGLLQRANFKRYHDTCFIQTGIVFEYLAELRNPNVLWLGDCSITSLKKDGLKKISWELRTFEIWVGKWPGFVFSLPPKYSISSKLDAVLGHNIKSNLFSLKNLMFLRGRRAYGFGVFNRYRDSIYCALSKKQIMCVLLVSLIPPCFSEAILDLVVSSIKGLRKSQV